MRWLTFVNIVFLFSEIILVSYLMFFVLTMWMITVIVFWSLHEMWSNNKSICTVNQPSSLFHTLGPNFSQLTNFTLSALTTYFFSTEEWYPSSWYREHHWLMIWEFHQLPSSIKDIKKSWRQNLWITNQEGSRRLSVVFWKFLQISKIDKGS